MTHSEAMAAELRQLAETTMAEAWQFLEQGKAVPPSVTLLSGSPLTVQAVYTPASMNNKREKEAFIAYVQQAAETDGASVAITTYDMRMAKATTAAVEELPPNILMLAFDLYSFDALVEMGLAEVVDCLMVSAQTRAGWIGMLARRYRCVNGLAEPVGPTEWTVGESGKEVFGPMMSVFPQPRAAAAARPV